MQAALPAMPTSMIQPITPAMFPNCRSARSPNWRCPKHISQQLDRGLDFAPGTEDGGLGYSWWLMRWKHRAAGDRNLDFFAGITAGSGWLTVVGLAGILWLVVLQ